ncbi:hypothetical protein [Brevibacterium sediminis]|uniref:hypothetical protein n=1 Tax=Brevibacterium sediminis TaxID=1857024 RepID=UPI003B3AF2F9
MNGTDTGANYVVPVFPGDHDRRTNAAGILSEDGESLVHSITDPDVIDAIAARLNGIADEIRTNQDPVTFGNIVSGIDWGPHDPPDDI